jgi:predicted NBD/HSP70 family sugar kinase
MFEISSTRNRVKTGFSQQQTKRNNTILLFNLIRKNSPISRIMLAEATGLSATTVSMLIEDLIANNLVRELGEAEPIARGRRPIMLEVNATGGYFIVVEMINTGLICHLFDLKNRHLDFMQYRISGDLKPNVTSDFIGQMLYKKGIPPSMLMGINVIYPGIVDRAAKKMVYSVIVPTRDLLNESEMKQLQDLYPNAVFMLNNYSSVSAYGEYIINDYDYNRSLVAVNIFEAVGAGAIFVNEKGEKTVDFSIELGHMMMDRNGPVCKCGNRGCLEALVGICALFKRVEQATGINLDYTDEFNHSQNVEAMKKVKDMADSGNEDVIRILDEAAEWIALALTNMNNIIDPGYIFIGGTIRYLGENFLNMIRAKMKKLNLKHTDFPNIINYSHLDGEERLRGCIAMMMDDIFALRMEK